jgi:hypothetical protein
LRISSNFLKQSGLPSLSWLTSHGALLQEAQWIGKTLSPGVINTSVARLRTNLIVDDGA